MRVRPNARRMDLTLCGEYWILRETKAELLTAHLFRGIVECVVPQSRWTCKVQVRSNQPWSGCISNIVGGNGPFRALR